METKPTISIITVVLNGKDILAATIRSVVWQELCNFEYIIIDGGSTDGTLDVIRLYENLNIRWISEPDKGLYDAMNKGIQMAKGDYLWFINAGDELYSKDTTKLLDPLLYSADIIYSDTLVVDEHGEKIGFLSKLTHNNAPSNLKWQDMRRGMVVCHQSFIVKKEIAPLYDLNYRISSDIDWVIRCLKAANSVKITGHILSKFRKAGLSKKLLRKAMVERYHILKAHFGFFPNLVNHVFMLLRFLLKGRKSQV